MTFSPAADRNKAPIFEVLTRVLPGPAAVLEIASGTGQHAEHFAAARSDWDWQPTEADASALASLASRTAALRTSAPLTLDVLAPRWPTRSAVSTPSIARTCCTSPNGRPALR
jgi:hypothetical protein